VTHAKIKIECDDPLLSAAIASAISRGLESDGFVNQKAKVLMVHQESRFSAQDFKKKSTITSPDVIPLRPDLYMFELLPTGPYIDTVPPSLKDALIGRNPGLTVPILIDIGINPPKGLEAQTSHAYQRDEAAFLRGE
jgi:hypothetical protein